jgi:hypothetical protein
MAGENLGKPETSDYQIEGQSIDEKIFEEFCTDRETIAALGVTTEELRELSRASLLGTLTCKDDLLFLLRQIRQSKKPAEPPTNDQPTRDTYAMAETMRRAALAKLDESDFLKARSRGRAALRRIKTMLSRRNHSSPSYRTD